MEKGFSPKEELFNQFNSLLTIDSNLHPQEYELAQVKKWLTACENYRRLDSPVSKNPSSTEKAFASGIIYNHAIDTIDQNIRDLSPGIFSDNTPFLNGKNQPDSKTIQQNRQYFEEWMCLREQSRIGRIDTELIDKMRSAKQNFEKAWQTDDKNQKRQLLRQTLETTCDVQIDFTEFSDQPFTAATARVLQARTIRDLAEMGEFGNKHTAIYMAIEDLWDAAEEISAIDSSTLADWIKRPYLQEIEYFRGQFSESIGLNPDERPSHEHHIRTISSRIGQIATDQAKQPRAA